MQRESSEDNYLAAHPGIVRAIVGVCVVAAIAALGAGPSPATAGADGASAPAASAPANNDFTTAMALLQAGDIDAAVPRFERAAADQPDVFDHQLALATVYLRKQRGPEGWSALRKAVRLDPSNPQATAMFSEIWRRFDQRGVLNTGNPIAGVVGILGEPDRRHLQNGNDDTKGVVRFEYGFMAADFIDGKMFTVVDLRGLTKAAIRPSETLAPTFDQRNWRLGHRAVSRSSVIAEFVLPGETVQKYTELLSVRRHPELADRGVSAIAFAQSIRGSLEQSVQGVTFNVLRETPGEVVYEFIVPGGSNQPAQHEIARVIVGETDVHSIAFVKMGSAMGDDLRDAWAKRLSTAELSKKQVAAAGE